jgi:two-component system, cell cycle sensor histidine kinase and response regulator CckA
MTKRPRKAARSFGTVLVVDDDPSMRTLVRRLLEPRGYRVLDASDAAAAERIAKLYVGPIHLLLVEVDVSGTSGPALTERLRSLRPEPRVLFMSGHPPSKLVREGRLGARTSFIQKPFKGRELVLRVSGVLAAER